MALMTPLEHLASIRAAYQKARKRDDLREMRYEAACEAWWFARYNEDGTLRAKCEHNEMVATNNPDFAWRCAKCGYVFGSEEADGEEGATNIS